MKRLICLLLVCSLLLSLSSIVFGDNTYTPDSDGDPVTTATYTGTQTPTYTIEVPARLTPNSSGDVKLVGQWPPNERVVVTAPEEIDMENSIDGTIKQLGITYTTIDLAGSNTAESSKTESISVGSFEYTPLFGVWSGVIEYNVDYLAVTDTGNTGDSGDNGDTTDPSDQENKDDPQDPNGEQEEEKDSSKGLIMTAQEAEDLGFTFEWVNSETKKELNLTGYTGSEVNLVIPSYIKDFDGKIDKCPVVKIGGRSDLKSVITNTTIVQTVVIPNTVTSIEPYAFKSCASLTSVIIPNSVTSIGSQVFWACSSLISVTISDNVTSIGDNAFRGCTSLTSITIPNSVTSIGNNSFYNCSSLTGDLVIPNSVTSIGKSAFFDCTGLTSITIPDSVTSISSGAFTNVAKIINNSSYKTGSPWGALSDE